MEVKRASTAGFCMGVSLALRKNGQDGRPASRICTFGPIIHNPQVLRDYEEKGVACLNDPGEARSGDSVIIRAHGVPRGEEARLKACGATLMDATCPRVKNAQTAIERATAGGSSLLLFGDADHPEVRGLISYSHGPSRVFASLEALQAMDLDPEKSWVLASQTTQDATIFEEIRTRLAARLPNLQVLSTTSREHAENYNVAPGHTIVFINYNGRRLYIKTQNQNGLSYEMEEMVILKPEEFQQIQQAAVQNNIQPQKQEATEPEKYVSLDQYGKDFNSMGGAIIELKDRFEKLEKQFEEFIK